MRDVGDSDRVALRQAIFSDTLDVVMALSGASPVVVCEPPEACPAIAASTGVQVISQGPGDLGERMDRAFDDLFQQGAAAVILVGSDIPDLPLPVLEQARRWLRRPGDRAVLGPAADGGYYLVGLKAAHPELFAGIEWGTASVLDQTLERARSTGLEVHLLSRWHDVDERPDLERLVTSGTPGASRTRAWLAARGTGR
jgi:rSAM/selenodomain-associated transferase 1